MYITSVAAAIAAIAPVLVSATPLGGGGGGGGSGGGNTCTGKGQLNMYWGQDPSPARLGSYCETDKPDIITLGFVNLAPEHDPDTGYPGTNFAGHCGAYYYEKNGKKSKLLDCKEVQEDVAKCKKANVKILLSIGGHYDP